jgi:hypothetical protein
MKWTKRERPRRKRPYFRRNTSGSVAELLKSRGHVHSAEWWSSEAVVLNGGRAVFRRGDRQKSRKMGCHGNCEVGHENFTSKIKLLII